MSHDACSHGWPIPDTGSNMFHWKEAKGLTPKFGPFFHLWAVVYLRATFFSLLL